MPGHYGGMKKKPMGKNKPMKKRSGGKKPLGN